MPKREKLENRKDGKQLLIALSSCATQKDAEKLAKILLAKKLAACVSILPKARSLYIWKDKLCEEDECLLLIKSSAEAKEELATEFDQSHPYDTPELIFIPSDSCSADYAKWALANMKR